MKSREVQLIFPGNPSEKKSPSDIKGYSCVIPQKTGKDVYSLVEKFRKEVFPGIKRDDMREETHPEMVSLSQIINLHNAGEIRQRSTSISQMREKIELGEHVLMADDTPNIKLAKTNKGELVCFDGHHSILAYMEAERDYLHEVPHLLISDPVNRGLKDEEIHAFFGVHAEKLRDKDWRNYTISWTKPPEDQLEERDQRNMGELLSALKHGGRVD
ncbi:MAG: hypothetical protein ACOC7Z_00430 [Candidatus Bipolaricaulota bacterium]